MVMEQFYEPRFEPRKARHLPLGLALKVALLGFLSREPRQSRQDQDLLIDPSHICSARLSEPPVVVEHRELRHPDHTDPLFTRNPVMHRTAAIDPLPQSLPEK